MSMRIVLARCCARYRSVYRIMGLVPRGTPEGLVYMQYHVDVAERETDGRLILVPTTLGQFLIFALGFEVAVEFQRGTMLFVDETFLRWT